MAANEFATMIHSKTNKITLVLAYALLEWVLIVLLLLNSLFSYLIIKFAHYFGLTRPCLLCSRLDHILDPSKKERSYRELLCDDHAMEISKLAFCYCHRKVGDLRDMCNDCSSSDELSKEFAYFPWMTQIGMVQCGLEYKVIENGDVEDMKRCSCCVVSIEKRNLSPCLLIQPDWGILDYTHKGKSIKKEEIDEEFQFPSERIRSDSIIGHQEDEQRNEGKLGSEGNNNIQKIDLMKEEETDDKIDEGTQTSFDQHEDEQGKEENLGIRIFSRVPREKEDESEEHFSRFIPSCDCNKEMMEENGASKVDSVIEEKREETTEVELAVKMDHLEACSDKAPKVVSKHLEFYIDQQDCHLIPVEFYKSGEDNQQGLFDDNGDVILDFYVQVGTQADFIVEKNHFSEETFTLASSMDESKPEDDRTATVEASEEMCSNDDHQVQGSSDDLLEIQNDEEADAEAEVSVGTEILDHEQIDDVPSQEITHEDDDDGCNQAEDMLEFKTFTIETKKPVINTGIQFSSEPHEIEEERVPETPSSGDSLHNLHKRLLLLEMKESGTGDSLDSISVMSEIECPDGVLKMENLKSALREEQKTLNALYAELEEERSASAVAANQTMAMINRLQEEKAAMQMEALHYQRMMEEQAEYDQEALQLLNEVIVKREKEKAEIEKELEVYRKRVEEYEAREKMGMLRRRRRRRRRSDSCGSCTNTEDSDGLTSIDLSQDTREDEKDKDSNFDDLDGITEHENSPVDAVLCLEGTLVDFKEERLSILEQLKFLEEKLFTLNDEGGEEENFEDVKPIENGDGHIEESGNRHSHTKGINGKHKVLKSKRLHPLFDAAEAETENGFSSNGTHHHNGIDHLENCSVGKFEVEDKKIGVEEEDKKIAVEEEVDELYERLQGVEADREFLRHCMSSLSKGDKGVYLLEEILQHLRDLRNVELQDRNMGGFCSIITTGTKESNRLNAVWLQCWLRAREGAPKSKKE